MTAGLIYEERSHVALNNSVFIFLRSGFISLSISIKLIQDFWSFNIEIFSLKDEGQTAELHKNFISLEITLATSSLSF